jgi:hypothetical protein
MDVLGALNDAQDFLNQNNPLTEEQRSQFKQDGFMLPSTFSADGNGLPYTKVPTGKPTQMKRNIITWFVPEFGLVRMYVNPQSITYQHKKLIRKDRTKGGYTIQYWGEDLTVLDIRGTTGSSGIEGINMLYEIYRAEQYSFDSVGLSIAAGNAAAADLANLGIGAVGNAVGGLLGDSSGLTSGLLGGLLGADSPNANAMASKNITSLAELACGVEMYYNGWVFRGYFENMTVTEKADNFLLDYSLTFNAVQRRGYRQNYFPWNRSAKDGPSRYDTAFSNDGSRVT